MSGALSALLDMDIAVIEQLVKEQFRSKEKLIESNLHALHLGRDWALMNLQCPIGCACAVPTRSATASSSRAMRPQPWPRVYGGATVCAWYPITPSSSLADAFGSYCKRLRSTPRPSRTRLPSCRPRTSWPRSAW